MHAHDFPTNADRAQWGRDLLARLAAQTRHLPTDRDLHSRPVLIELSRDAITYLFHALYEADVDIAALADACVEDWQTDLSDEAHEHEQAATGQSEVRSLVAGAVGSSLYPPSRTEWWWQVAEDDDRIARLPLPVKQRIVAASVEAETQHMNQLLSKAAGTHPAPTWDPAAALTAVPTGEEADWPQQRLQELFEQAHRIACSAYPAIERGAVAAFLDHLAAAALRKGWELDLAAFVLPAAAESWPALSRNAVSTSVAGLAAPIGATPAWRATDGHWEVLRELTEADAALLVQLAEIVTRLMPAGATGR
ncbi:hypothetical protein LO763_11670 [Glycomyces sp. A-F 0318]|uniref:hypothetical protein n=1 Tax=Glycomyces amatae TaxID=2881355 RepID=UPI001E60A95A|nr:hypothetical protein [Glycomyces amatae]MCD0444280.1 hypothetical protein [Glycomyces amatae]